VFPIGSTHFGCAEVGAPVPAFLGGRLT
jgi:hypothetical protein